MQPITPKNPRPALSETAKPRKKAAPFALGLAAFLGTLAGCLPMVCPLNVCSLFILAFFRIPLLAFFFFFAVFQWGIRQYGETILVAWGLQFLTSPSTMDSARHIVQAPFLCLLWLNHARICGGIFLGMPAGLLLGLFVMALANGFRKPKEEPPA